MLTPIYMYVHLSFQFRRAVMIHLSSYVRGLQKEGRERYVEKLKYDKGTKSLPDPYTLPPSH